jgi:hypothetical protein
MEAARTSETLVDNYFTRQYISEDNSELHTRHRENLKSHITISSLSASYSVSNSGTQLASQPFDEKETINHSHIKLQVRLCLVKMEPSHGLVTCAQTESGFKTRWLC